MRKVSFFRSLFVPRDLIIRTNNGVRCFTLPVSVQAFVFAFALLCVLWCGLTTAFFVKSEGVLIQKVKEAQTVSTAYDNLVGEVRVLNDRLGEVLSGLDVGIAVMEDAAEKMPVSAKKSDEDADEPKEIQMLKKAETLRSDIAFVRERLAGLIDGGDAGRDKTTLYKTALQRDLAMSESVFLQRKVRKMEKLIANMQDAQVLAFRKMADVAGKNIDVIENNLDGIKQSLQNAGIGMSSLLSRVRRDKETAGTGGPYIPAPIPRSENRLNISLVSLNRELDRWYDLSSLQEALPIGQPVKRIRVTSPFGAREDPFQGAPARHEAVDLGGMTGEPVFATAPGKVIRAGQWGWYGNMVEIDHGLGFRTRYAHMDKLFVSKGDAVRAGDRIGTVGNTGRSTGAHLHYEIRVRGYPVDPMTFIKAKRNVFKG